MSFDDVCLIRNLFVFVSFTSKEMHYVFRFVEKILAISILISSWYIGTCPDCSQCCAALLPIFTPKRFSLLIFSIFTESCNASLTFSDDRLDRKELHQSDIIVLRLWAQLLIPLFNKIANRNRMLSRNSVLVAFG